YYLCAERQDAAGQPLEALRWLHRIEREFPSSAYIHPRSRLFRKYLYHSSEWENLYVPWYLKE
ncbi:hypothetical protein FJY63_12490, partial [Candidatus Sumerlaeota bacterium]|nr:hypothetical protein [Candidatus Sumerlaeota bacterium]